jgi:hypothetical protein
MGSCSLSKEYIEPILEALVGNVNIEAIEVDLSDNNSLFNGKGVAYLTDVMSRSSCNLSAINLSQNVVKDKKLLVQLLEGCSKIKKLSKVNVSQMTESVKDKHSSLIANALLALVKEVKNLKEIGLGGYGKSILTPVLEELAKNESVQVLDITGNGLGDKGIEQLATLLRRNQVLRTLKMDFNEIGMNGFQSLDSAFKYNKTLAKVPFPINDFQLLLNSLQENWRKVQLLELYSRITTKLYMNSLNYDVEVEVVPTPTFVAPHANVPQELLERKSKLKVDEAELAKESSVLRVSSDTIVVNDGKKEAESVASDESGEAKEDEHALNRKDSIQMDPPTPRKSSSAKEIVVDNKSQSRTATPPRKASSPTPEKVPSKVETPRAEIVEIPQNPEEVPEAPEEVPEVPPAPEEEDVPPPPM